jgi:hypothetical protein
MDVSDATICFKKTGQLLTFKGERKKENHSRDLFAHGVVVERLTGGYEYTVQLEAHWNLEHHIETLRDGVYQLELLPKMVSPPPSSTPARKRRCKPFLSLLVIFAIIGAIVALLLGHPSTKEFLPPTLKALFY